MPRSAVVLLTLIAVAVRVQAACTTTAACLGEIEAAQRGTQTMAARFVQTKRVSLLDEPLVSRGRFAFRQPDRVRWELEEPQPVTVVINGRNVDIPDLPASERQAMALSPVTAVLTELGAVFTGSLHALEKRFAVEAREDGGAVRVHLVPRDATWQQTFRSIDITFSRPALLISDMRLENALGDSVQVTFADVQRNLDLPASLFDVPTPPAEKATRP